MGDFTDGWWHYWLTFTHSWPFVVGFAVASILSSLLYESVKAVALYVWDRV